MTDHTENPDYSLDEVIWLTTPAQFKALADTARAQILGLLGQRAMTTQQLAALLGMPKGTAGHHLKVLESAGLIQVVRTRPVRAVTEKYYGLVARLYRISQEYAPGGPVIPVPPDVHTFPLRQAQEEYAPAPPSEADPSTFVITHARLSAHQAHDYALRLEALAQEFRQDTVPGEPVYGLVAGVYRSNWPLLPDPANAADAPAAPRPSPEGDDHGS